MPELCPHAEWRKRFADELQRLGFCEGWAVDDASCNDPGDWEGLTPEEAARQEAAYAELD